MSAAVLCNTYALSWPLIFIWPWFFFGLSRTPVHPPGWRREQGETFALPVVLLADSSHQSPPVAPRDDKQEWRTYLSRPGFNGVSAFLPLIGNYLVHQEFWHLSKSHSLRTYRVSNLELFWRLNRELHHTAFIKSLERWRKNSFLIGSILIWPWQIVWVLMRFTKNYVFSRLHASQ